MYTADRKITYLLHWNQSRRQKMLGIIAAVLIVLWLLGFLAFHVSTGLIHILLVVGLILLVIHFFSGRASTA
jgi:membrane-bound ClpP family serine protease